ncbi:hypothetical protein GGP72_000601 [Salinibacter ruber]|uniref:Uncharacterized protein n=1 Tax=Salinibacter ruber TaxID=146919 RepID=A0A9X2RGB0_9BACT|nr:hypothetical protein [Salinibacter ruber]MCS3647029.1 hypothetical protein [Salinibacter ruber]MCS3674358.1 hypothetical protein [Salinibacter ruber]MCS3676693.1 hypothetical protein [Salinibacter ruber]MCS3679981.1 hypothetical protein [Salinibacter ruber]
MPYNHPESFSFSQAVAAPPSYTPNDSPHAHSREA